MLEKCIFMPAFFGVVLLLTSCSQGSTTKSDQRQSSSEIKTAEAQKSSGSHQKAGKINTDKSKESAENAQAEPGDKSSDSGQNESENRSGQPTSEPSVPTTTSEPGKKPADALLALHTPSPPSCVGCHEKNRLAPDHYKGKDCALCHNFPSFKQVSFTHDPKPMVCEECHARPTTVGLRAYPNQGPPANFNPQDKTTLGSGHYRGKDCSQCHQTPKEGASRFNFTHSTPNPMACLPCHFNNGLEEHRNGQNVMLSDFGNCYSCHKNFDVKTERNFGRN